MDFEFKRGSESSLEGKVVMYSELLLDSGNKVFVVSYGTSDLDDLAQTISMPAEELKQIKEMTKAVKEFEHDPLLEHNTIPEGCDFFSAKVGINALETSIYSLKGIDADIVYVGMYSKFNEAESALRNGICMYCNMMKKQPAVNKKEALMIPEFTSYENIGRNNFVAIALKEYLMPLAQSQERKDTKQDMYIRAKFRELIGKSNALPNDEICRLNLALKDCKSTANQALIAKYLNLIDAIRKEEYEKAEELKKEIGE